MQMQSFFSFITLYDGDITRYNCSCDCTDLTVKTTVSYSIQCYYVGPWHFTTVCPLIHLHPSIHHFHISSRCADDAMGQQPYFVLHHEHKVHPLGQQRIFFSVYPGLTTGGQHANIMTLEHNENRINQFVADLLLFVADLLGGNFELIYKAYSWINCMNWGMECTTDALPIYQAKHVLIYLKAI